MRDIAEVGRSAVFTIPPPKQKPTAPTRPLYSAFDFKRIAAATKSPVMLPRSSWRCSSRPSSPLPGVAAERGEGIRREGQETREPRASRDILIYVLIYLRIEAPVLVDDQVPEPWLSNLSK